MPTVSMELTSILVLAVTSIFWLAGLSFSNGRNKDEIKELKEENKKFAHCDEFKDFKKRVEKDVDILHLKHNDLSTEIRKDMSDVKTTLARIEERLCRE